MPTFTATDFNTMQQVTIQVTISRWKSGRRNIRRSGNGRLLGWVTRPTGDHGKDDPTAFQVHATSLAFCGDSPGDEGHVMDHVPAHLVRNQAPAVGYGRHAAVKPWRGKTQEA
jgi:hypothetical protein